MLQLTTRTGVASRIQHYAQTGCGRASKNTESRTIFQGCGMEGVSLIGGFFSRSANNISYIPPLKTIPACIGGRRKNGILIYLWGPYMVIPTPWGTPKPYLYTPPLRIYPPLYTDHIWFWSLLLCSLVILLAVAHTYTLAGLHGGYIVISWVWLKLWYSQLTDVFLFVFSMTTNTMWATNAPVS